MEFLIELILELFFEGGEEICSDRRISKWIRYPIAIIIILFISAVILGILFLGIYFLKDTILIGIFFIIISIVMIIGALMKFKKLATERGGNSDNLE